MDKDDRIRGAIWGQLIGDAITLGTHWIYSAEEMKRTFPEVQGFETPRPGHYHAGKVSGDSTHLGEGCRLMLQSIAVCKKFDAADFLKRFRDFFGSSSYKGYIDRPTRGTLQNLEEGIFPPGADDDQTPTGDWLAPVVCFYLDSPELEKKVEEATLCTQNNPKTISYMLKNAHILADLVHGQKKLLQEESSFQGTDEEAMRKLGLSCHLDEAFPLALYFANRYIDSFEKALLANTRAGGDSAGRGGILGAWLGTLHGVKGIPATWIDKIRGKDKIASWIEDLIQARHS